MDLISLSGCGDLADVGDQVLWMALLPPFVLFALIAMPIADVSKSLQKQ